QPVRPRPRLAPRPVTRGRGGDGRGDAARHGDRAGRGGETGRGLASALHTGRRSRRVRRRDTLPHPTPGGRREPGELHVRRLRSCRRRDVVRTGEGAFPWFPVTIGGDHWRWSA